MMEVGTDLYQWMLAYNFENDEHAALMREVWEPTPWMVDSYTGSYDDGRMRDMLHWCYGEFGDQASPIHDRPGHWQRGGATIHGWTWFGFSNKLSMDAFVERWPVPEAVAA